MINLCECGCGEYAKERRIFISGHQNRGRVPTHTISEETRKKMRIANRRSNNGQFKKGNKSWNAGKTFTAEEFGNMGMVGKKHSEESKKRMQEVKEGRKPYEEAYIRTAEIRKKMSDSHLGNMHSGETRKKMSIAHSGERNHNYGKIFSVEHRQKIAIGNMKCRTDGYCDAWSDKEFKNDYRKNYCELCKVSKKIAIGKDGRSFSNLLLHHKNMDKQDCNPKNLQTLCRCCHMNLHRKLQIDKNNG